MAYLLQHLLLETAARAPDAVAVRFGADVLTYAELEERSARLASLLREIGVRRGDRVALHVGKSTAAIVAVLAVLRSGAAYVPLDPVAPGQRLGFILRDCGVRVALSGPGSVRRARTEPIVGGAEALETVIVVEGDAANSPGGLAARETIGWHAAMATPPDRASLARVAGTEDDLAYILYTSGSTGEPKGVAISHRNALTFVDWCQSTFSLTREDRVSNHAPFHFDLSIFDIFVSLKAGASIHPVPEGLSTFPLHLADWIERAAISVWYSVPSILTLLALRAKLADRDLSGLRLVLFAGEVFPLKHLKALVAMLPAPRYFNLYGPTETNVCTYYEVRPHLLALRETAIPIGTACSNFETFVVDGEDRLLDQPGSVGELLVRGPGVALGYWGRAERAARAFVQNPLHNEFRDIVYRTGDVVAIDDDGAYAYLGRKDHQIKSRGYRIELGEVEHVIYAHPLVREAAAVAVPDELVGNRIKAVVSLVPGAAVGAAELQAFCAERLPRYMIPEVIDFRPSLPRTLNGKVDRILLAAGT